MMTRERAQYILGNRKTDGDLKFMPRYKDGITYNEDRYIRAVWIQMPGYTCYSDAIIRISIGRVPDNVQYK